MVLTRSISKVGCSLKVTIPSQFAECLDLKEGSRVSIGMTNNQVILTPISPDRQVPQEIGAAAIPKEECAGV
jgi:antitoxin component of MazEF toxin-antitoxin module